MKTISIRDLHLETGQRVREVATGQPLVVTDHGRPIAMLQAWEPGAAGRPLPDREARIRKRSVIPVDSVLYQSEMRDRS